MAAKTASLSVNIIADAAKAKAGLKEAETAFGKFRNSVGQADGAMGKFKATSGAALDYVKSNAMNFAAAAGAAVVAFGVKSVNAFQDLALSAGKFSDATGMAVEDASRLIEVAGDIGVEAASVEKSIGFMNKALGNSPELFKNLGIQIEYTKSGATDVSATFLNVVDRLQNIKDPAERAAAATKLLGRGWMDMSELIAGGSQALAKSMAAVSDQKVISDEELRKARDYRAAMDDLKDRFEDISLAVGSKLAPAFANAIEDVLGFVDALKDIPGLSKALSLIFNPGIDESGRSATLAGLITRVFNLGEETEKTTVVTDQMARAWKDGYRAMIDAVPAADNLTSAMDRQQQAIDEAKAAWDIYRGSLNFRAEYLRLEENIEGFRTKWAGTTEEAKRKSKEYQQELLNIQIQIANAALQVVGLATTAQNNTIRLYTDTRQLEQALSLINAIRAGMNKLGGAVTPDRVERLVSPKPGGVYVDGVYIPPGIDFSGFMAKGGIVDQASLAVIGEAGPEVVLPLNDPRRAMDLMRQSGLDNLFDGVGQIPMLPMQASGVAQSVINVRVDAGLVSSPDQVGQQIIDAIRRAERRSGQVFAAA